jgi:hypothetical protein
MSTIPDAFSASYAEARIKFVAAAEAAGLSVEGKSHPLQGRDGEELALDVARDGAPDAARVLVLSSACHGVEGFCGSGIQVDALRDAGWVRHARERGVAVVYLHALNPHGFSHLRRTTHENVDLNRNFHDFDAPLPVNAAYRELHPLLIPPEWPPSAENTQAIMQYVTTRGEGAFQAAVSGGQYEFPDGLFFGGTAPTWSNLAVREALRHHGRRAARIAWIDIHTGLGPSGLGERIYAGPDDAATVARCRAWWAGNGRTPVTSIYDGSSTSAKLSGMMWSCVAQECPQAEYTGIALEYGTVPVMETMQALRGDHWLHVHPEAEAPLRAAVHREMLRAFYTDTDAWREQVVLQAREALRQAVEGLCAA